MLSLYTVCFFGHRRIDDLLLDATSRSVFEIGFKYGMRFAVAGLSDDKNGVDNSEDE